MKLAEHPAMAISSKNWRVIARLLISCAFIAIIVGICLSIHPLHPATVALLMLLAILIVASKWGMGEAIAMTLLGAAAFAYYFLPPEGWSVQGIEHQVALITFVAVAFATGKLAGRARSQTILEKQRRVEAEQLYALVRDISTYDRVDALLVATPNLLVRTFGVSAAAFYFLATQQAVRAGTEPSPPPNEKLRSAALGLAVESVGFLGKISVNGEPIGSLWLAGPVPGNVIESIVERLEIRLERLAAAEKHNEAEAVRKSQELGSAVLDALIHEIKTPLSVVKAATTTLLSHADGVVREEMLSMISEEVDHLDMTVNDVLWTAHVKSGMLRPRIESNDLKQLVRISLAELESRTKSRPLKIEVPDVLPCADFDFQMAKVVLKELVNNALKFSLDGSPVAISVTQVQAEIVTSVRDWGAGIAPGEEVRIFEKHYRGKVVSAGTGLGLAFAKTIVEAHGGRIGATRAPDHGSVFYFSLPVSQGRAA